MSNDHAYSQAFLDEVSGDDAVKSKILSGFTYKLEGETLSLFHKGKLIKKQKMDLRWDWDSVVCGYSERYIKNRFDINFRDNGEIDKLVDVRNNDDDYAVYFASKPWERYLKAPEKLEAEVVHMTKFVTDHARGRCNPCGEEITFLPYPE